MAGEVRREALRPPDAVTPILLDVPAGATRASTAVTAHRGGLDAILAAEVGGHLEALDASGRRLDGASAQLAASGADSATWTPLSLALPPGATRIRLAVTGAQGCDIAWSRPVFSGIAPSHARNVLLVSLDTVRVDAIGAWGQELPVTPHLDALAARGTRWTQAISTSSWTLPAHVSVMTGLWPSWHGRWDHRVRSDSLPPMTTLAAVLGRAGFDTAAFTGRGSISWELGATQGFGLVVEHALTGEVSGGRECDRSAAAAIEWLERGRSEGAPFLLFWHTYEPHFPYEDDRFLGSAAHLPPGVGEEAREDWLRYLGDLAAADEALGRLIDALDRLGLAASTDIVLFSDHGEEFGEHSAGRRVSETRHGHGCWDTLVRVPLVVAARSLPPGRRDEQVSLADLFPTVLSLAGVAPPPSQGRSLFERGGHARLGIEALYTEHAAFEQKAWRESGRYKYVARLSSPPAERLFDLEDDPRETRDATAILPFEADLLRTEASAFFASAPTATSVRQDADRPGSPIPPEVLESLRSLGYVK